VRVHPGVITQVLSKPGGNALSVQVRHRRNEAVGAVTVNESDRAVAIHASVGTPEDDRNADYTSFAVTFSWVRTELGRPLGARQIIYTDARDTGSDRIDRSSAVDEPPTQTATRPTDEQQQQAQPPVQTHQRRTPFMLMVLIAFTVALLVTTRRAGHR
jgi:hypothetical protein